MAPWLSGVELWAGLLVTVVGATQLLGDVASERLSYPGALTGRYAPRQNLPDWLRAPRWYTQDAPRWGQGETGQLVNELADHNANVFRLGMMWGGRAHYPSQVAPRSPSLKEGVDPLAEALATAKERGAHILTYLNPNAVYEGHPLYDEIAIRNEQGQIWDVKAYGIDKTRYACPNHPKFAAFYRSVLRELFIRYNPDGIYVDGLSPHVCYCEHCRRKFREDTGRELPAGLTRLGPLGVLWEMTSDWDVLGDPASPDDVLFSRWLMKCLTDLTRTFTEAVREVKPLAVTTYHSWPKPDNLKYYDATLNEIYASRPWHFTLWKRAEFSNWGDVFEVPSLVNIYLRQTPWEQEKRREITSETEARHLYWQTMAQGAFPNSWGWPGMTKPFEVLRDHADCFDFPTTFPVKFLAFPRAMFTDARHAKIGSAVLLPLTAGEGRRLRLLEREPNGRLDLLCLRTEGKSPTDEEYQAGNLPPNVIYLRARDYDPNTSLLQAGQARWGQQDDPAALSGAYLTSLGHGRGTPQTHLDYALPPLKSDGPWALWARVVFPDVGSDSFYWQLSNDDGQSWAPGQPSDDAALGWEQPQQYAWVKARAPQGTRTVPTDRFLSPYVGMYAGLLHARLPVKELHPNHLTQASLKGFRVLVLANEVCLSEEQCEVIRRLVRGGMGLIATGETSLYYPTGKRRQDFGLADVFGCSATGQSLPIAEGRQIVRSADHPVAAALPEAGVPDHEEHLIVRPTQAQTVAVVQTGEAKAPALLVREFGKGRVVYLPGRLDSSYSNWADAAFPKLMAAAVDWVCHGEVPVRVGGEGLVGVTLFEQPQRNRWLVHLVNFSADWSASYDELKPMANVGLTVRPPQGKQVRSARAVLAGQDLPLRTSGGVVSVTLPRLEEYEIVAVTFR
jgi:hypothetical protein